MKGVLYARLPVALAITVAVLLTGVNAQGGVQVEMESRRLTLTEEMGSIDVCVVVTSGQVTTPNTVTISTTGGSAVAGRDFTPFVELELTFTAGATRVCEPLSVAQDDLVEGDEFFSVAIIRTDFSLGSITTTEITIEDSDQLTIGFNDTIFTVVEGDAPTVCAEIQGGNIDRAVIVNIDAPPNGGNATSDTTDQDYIAITNIRTFNPLPGQTIANPVCASFTAIDENAEVLPQTVIVEDIEFFEVVLTSSDSVIIIPEFATARVVIIDNDGATVILQSSDMSLVEGNAGDMTTVDVCLELIHAWARLERDLQFTFSISTQGTADSNDFSPAESTVVTFPSTSVVGDTVCQQYTIIGDDVKEIDDTFTVSVSVVNNFDMINGTDQVTVTITDDGDVRQDCGLLDNPENGLVTISPSTLDGGVATYTCNLGFTLDGFPTRTCQRNPPTIPGVWSGVAPTCIPVDCGAPPGPGPDGEVDFTLTTFGASATYTCTTMCYGLVPNTPTRTCTESSTWSGDDPTCQFVDCGPPPNIMGCFVSHTTTDCGSEASYSPILGNTLIGDATLTCDQDGNWNEDPGLEFPQCPEDGICPPPPFPTGDDCGTVAVSSLAEGAVATYSCDPRCRLEPSNGDLRNCMRINETTGFWSGEVPSCIPILCDELSVANGVVDSDGNQFGAVARYSCNETYVLVGPEQRTCEGDGMWSGDEPQCNPAQCDRSLLRENENDGTITTDTPEESSTFHSAMFICNDGCMITRVCQSNLTLPGNLPCPVPRCGTLSPPENGTVFVPESPLFGAVATYKCNNDSELIGNEERICECNNEWSGEAPSCEIEDTTTPGGGDGDDGDDNLGLIIGVAIGAFVLLLILVILIICCIACCVRARKKKKDKALEDYYRGYMRPYNTVYSANAPKNDVPPNSMEMGNGAEKDIHQWEQDQPAQQVDTIFQDEPDEDDDLPSPAPSSPMSEYRLRLHDVETQSIGSQSRVKARIVAEKV